MRRRSALRQHAYVTPAYRISMQSPKEKPILFGYRRFVHAQGFFAPHQRGYQHQQSALRQVEVGNQRIHGAR